MTSYLPEQFNARITEKFPDFSFTYRQLEYTGNIPVFFVTVNTNEKELSTNWRKIVDFIGVHFQTTLVDEFAVWNIYLFFCMDFKISDELKYLIENDTFSSRKIIIETKMEEEEIINEHIQNRGLSLIKSTTKSSETFKHHPVLWEFLEKQGAKIRTDEAKNKFSEIVKKLKQPVK